MKAIGRKREGVKGRLTTQGSYDTEHAKRGSRAGREGPAEQTKKLQANTPNMKWGDMESGKPSPKRKKESQKKGPKGPGRSAEEEWRKRGRKRVRPGVECA